MRAAALVASLSLVLSGCGGDTPEQLTARVQAVLDKGDVDGALTVGDFARTPPQILFFWVDQVTECASDDLCKVSTAPYDEERAKKDAEQSKQMGMTFPAKPEGLLVIDIQGRSGNSSGSMKMPYANVGGTFKILAPSLTDEKIAELKAKTTQALVDEKLSEGIYDYDSQQNRTDWKTAATALPADGGEIGQWYVKDVADNYAAYAAGDVDRVLALGGDLEKALYGPTNFEGQPVAKEVRQAALRAQLVRKLKEVKVLGGYQLGNQAVLMVEGLTSGGWVERGAVVLARQDGKWGLAGRNTVSYPAP